MLRTSVATALVLLCACRTTDDGVHRFSGLDCDLRPAGTGEAAVSTCDMGRAGSERALKMVVFGEFEDEFAEHQAGYPSMQTAAALVRRYGNELSADPSSVVISRLPERFPVVSKQKDGRVLASYFKWYNKALKLSAYGVGLTVLSSDREGFVRMALCIMTPIDDYRYLDEATKGQGICERQTATLLEGGWRAYLETYASSENYDFSDERTLTSE